MNKHRKRLFKDGNPLIREATVDDIALYLYAYRYVNGEDPENGYREMVIDNLASFDHLRIVEDRNAAFPEGFAPVGIFMAFHNGWSMEPHVEWFPWASTRNKVRATVAYLYQQRRSRDVGVAVVHTRKENRDWFKKLSKYVPLYQVGRIPGGYPDGDDYVFYLRGRKRLNEQSVSEQI